jgi:hypothetical protein
VVTEEWMEMNMEQWWNAMAQVVIHQTPSPQEAQAQSQGSPCEICRGWSGTRTGFFPKYLSSSLSLSVNQSLTTKMNLYYTQSFGLCYKEIKVCC